jgi:hypothetical protein
MPVRLHVVERERSYRLDDPLLGSLQLSEGFFLYSRKLLAFAVDDPSD